MQGRRGPGRGRAAMVNEVYDAVVKLVNDEPKGPRPAAS
jgi:hypothetical protein